MTTENAVPQFPHPAGNRGTAEPNGLPRVWWSPWKGWLYVQDPEDGQVYAIYYKDAPWGYSRIATATSREMRRTR